MVALLALATFAGEETIVSPPESLRQGWYSKAIAFEGMPIIASDQVEDRALFVAKAIFAGMLQNVPRSWLASLARRRVHFAIIAEEEQTTDLPEYRYLKGDRKTDWNKRARGFGGPAASGAEENILEYPTDRYRGQSILIHEFAHTLETEIFAPNDPRFARELALCYRDAVRAGLCEHLRRLEPRGVLGDGRPVLLRRELLRRAPEQHPQRGLQPLGSGALRSAPLSTDRSRLRPESLAVSGRVPADRASLSDPKIPSHPSGASKPGLASAQLSRD